MKTLFVPVDLSDHAYKALDYAISLAKDVQSKKLVVYHHNPPIYAGDIPVLYTDDLERIHLEIKEHLEKELKKRLAKMEMHAIETEVRVSQETGPVSSIIHHAKATQSDLIVMGSHGHTGLHDLVFGSVTAGVVEDSPIPVLAIPNHFTYKPIEKISFASTLKSLEAELKLVSPFTSALHANLEIVHLQYEWDPKTVALEGVAVMENWKNPSGNLVVLNAKVEKSISEQIRDYTQKSKPDWLVMFPRRLSWFSKIFISSTSLSVLHHSRKPMLLITQVED